MQEYNTIIGKLLSAINRKKFKKIVDNYRGDFAVKKLSCWEQFVAVFLGQITESSTLREIVDLIKFHSNQQYHLGIRKDVARSTLAKANETRNWRIYRDIFLDLINNLKQKELIQTKEVIEIIDSTPINLDISKHPWIETTMKVKGLKTHVVYNLNDKIPTVFEITGARINDITLVTNDFKRSDKEIAELYKQRWQIELFFKWIKQNLKIKKFLGRSENAIKTQICIAMISFVLLRLAEALKEICEEISPKNLLKIIGNSLFNCLRIRDYGRKRYKNPNQLQFEWVLNL